MTSGRQPDERGFTLAELMVTVLLIGVLVAAGFPTLRGAKSRAQDGAAKATLRSALSVASVYAATNTAGSYPQSTELTSDDAGITYVAPATPSTQANMVSSSATGSVFKASAMSKSGTCQSVASISGTTTWGYGASPCDGNVYVSTNFVGSGTGTFLDGTGTAAGVRYPYGLEIDPASGTLYVADTYTNRIRAVTPAGVTTTLAGSGVGSMLNGTGTAATFKYPVDIAIDGSGNLFVADQGNYAIRKVTPAGVVTTVAGSGVQGTADGTGTAATFNFLNALVIDVSGNLFVGDSNKIRKITPAGVVTTLTTPGIIGTSGMEIDSAGNLYVSNGGGCSIAKVTPALAVSTYAGDGNCGMVDGTSTTASMRPLGLALDWSGNLWFADVGNAIRKVSPSGVVTTVVGSSSSGDGEGVAQGARFNIPRAVAVTSTGIVYVADTTNHRIKKLS